MTNFVRTVPFVLAIIVAVLSVTDAKDKMKVSVYYETLCPDSKRFITKQLYPVKKSSLGEHFEVDLVPYGKADTTATSDGSFEFSCQHGQAECEGNKMHACALKHINSTELQLEFIYCSMKKNNPPQSLEACAEKVGIETAEISACTENKEGPQLLATNGERTHALRPKLYFVPWITYDEKFTDENLQNSQTGFKAVLCNELKSSGRFQCPPDDRDNDNSNGGFSIKGNANFGFLVTIVAKMLVLSRT